MSNEMIEKAATSIWERTGYKLSDESVKHVINAMREPTIGQENNYYKMKRATGNSELSSCFSVSEWQMMIDAALKDD